MTDLGFIKLRQLGIHYQQAPQPEIENSKSPGRVIAFNREWGLNYAAIRPLDQSFHSAFGFFQLRVAVPADFDALLEQFQSSIESKLAPFQLHDDFLKQFQIAFEIFHFHIHVTPPKLWRRGSRFGQGAQVLICSTRQPS
jgi:hypothetical protein